jgi:predicted HicB family RNase H-like nuclease
MARPREIDNGLNVGFRIAQADYEEAQEAASRRGVSLGQYLRESVRAKLDSEVRLGDE